MTLLLIAVMGQHSIYTNTEKISFNYNSSLQPTSINWNISLDLSGLYCANKLYPNHLGAITAELCRLRQSFFFTIFFLVLVLIFSAIFFLVLVFLHCFFLFVAVPVQGIVWAVHRMGYRPKMQATIGSAALKLQGTDAASVLISPKHKTSCTFFSWPFV